MRKLVIAISGPPGVGTSSIARELAKKLGLKFFSPGQIFKAHIKEREAKAALEMWKTRLGKSKRLHTSLDETQREVARRGGVVICGKLSIHFLSNLADYKIWVHAPLRVRAERTAVRDGIPVKAALEQIKRREIFERKEFRRIYGFDYFDQRGRADFILDNTNLTLAQAVDKILKFIGCRTPKS